MSIMRNFFGHMTICKSTPAGAPPIKQQGLLLHQGCVHWVRYERREYSMNTVMAAVSAKREVVCGCGLYVTSAAMAVVPARSG